MRRERRAGNGCRLSGDPSEGPGHVSTTGRLAFLYKKKKKPSRKVNDPSGVTKKQWPQSALPREPPNYRLRTYRKNRGAGFVLLFNERARSGKYSQGFSSAVISTGKGPKINVVPRGEKNPQQYANHIYQQSVQ